MGERLLCTIRAVTEVRAVTEETLAVRGVGSATLAPHTVSQVRVIVPTPRARGTVMIDPGPGPLGLCPVPGIVEVEQDSSIWLANTGSQPIQIDKDEVVAIAECVLAEPGVSAGNDRDDGDEVNGLVQRASSNLTSEECRQLQTAMAARKHLLAKGKGDLGRSDIVQHQIHTGDQPASPGPLVHETVDGVHHGRGTDAPTASKGFWCLATPGRSPTRGRSSPFVFLLTICPMSWSDACSAASSSGVHTGSYVWLLVTTLTSASALLAGVPRERVNFFDVYVEDGAGMRRRRCRRPRAI